MKKNIKLLLIPALALCSISATIGGGKRTTPEPGSTTYYVDFYNNYLREDFTLSSGFTGKGNNLLFKSIQVQEGDKVTKPSETPTRKNYEFQGWYLEEKCTNLFDFETSIMKHTRLYAGWALAQKEDIVEPTYTPPSTVLPDSEANDYVIHSIMNFKVNDDIVKLPTASLMKLEASKDNVLPLMEYQVKNGKTLTATYAESKITVTCEEAVRVITVKDDSLNLVVSNTNYETKAKKYEAKALEEESYHVMLAGSSSIEFWESSKEDLAPIVSYNHGIGGTTIEEWDEKLNQRLVYPYKPKMVVYYVGINNVINSKEDATTISGRLTKFFNDTHEALPNTQVQYILMNLIPNYKGYFDIIKSVNADVVEYQKSNASWLTLINPGEALVKENGEPNAAYFRTDGLHLSYYGYVVWGGIIKESILDGLEAMI